MRSVRHIQAGSSRRCRRGGFTLIEVLASLVLVGIVLPVVMKGVSLALSGASSARHTTEAAGLAEMKLNELAVTGDWQLGMLSGDFEPDWPGYRWTAATTTHDDGTVELDVDVLWTARGTERSATVSTLLYPGTTTQ